MEKEIEQQCGSATEPFGSPSSISSSTFSFRSEEYLDLGYHPPVSELEEIPSLRWLSASFFPSKLTPSPSPSHYLSPGGDANKMRPAGYHAFVSVFGGRRSNQAPPRELEHQELDLFQVHVARKLHSLVSHVEDEQKQKGQQRRPLVTLCFLRKLLGAFVCIEEEFKALLLVLVERDPVLVHRSPVGRLVTEHLDRSIWSLDVCNAIADALDSLHFCKGYAEIAATALHQPSAPRGWEAQFHRARRSLSNLLAFLVPEQYSQHAATNERAWLFGRSSSGPAARDGDGGSGDPATSRYGRLSVSLSLSQNWSAAKQVEAMWTNFSPPRGAEATALAMAIYTMSAVMVLVVRTLVLAFSRQWQGPSAFASAAARPLGPPWQAPWAAPLAALQERIAEECRRERKGPLGSRAPSPGLLGELQSLARCGRAVVDLEGFAPGFPPEDRHREDMADVGRELAATCRAVEEQLGPLRWQVILASPAMMNRSPSPAL